MQPPFHPSYAQARAAFLDAAAAAQAQISSDEHPLRGRDGELLAVDVAVLGDAAAPKRLLLSSGCHGVEGYCGSGVQIAALRDAALHAACRAAGVTLVLAHALNPYGFSHVRRVTHENVDLNRNFLDFDRPLPVNEAYAALHATLLPADWPPDAANQRAIGEVLATRGFKYLQAAVSGGQYEFGDGLFFGGNAPTWSNLAFRRLLRQHLAGATQLGWIDLHTGLGPAGHAERIFMSGCGDFDRASRWWGSDGHTPLTRAEDGSSSSAVLAGTIAGACRDECPRTQVTAISLEFGTVPPLQMLQALRAEQWLTLRPEAGAGTHRSIKQQLLDALFVDTPPWCASILEHSHEAIAQAVAGLGSNSMPA
jgi:Protein of unknown function (DUF2817)